MAFDALRLPPGPQDHGNRQLMRSPYTMRRQALFDAVCDGAHIHLPSAYTGSLQGAIDTGNELRMEGASPKSPLAVIYPANAATVGSRSSPPGGRRHRLAVRHRIATGQPSVRCYWR